MNKILFLDLDGTLLNDKKLITPKTRQALDAYMEGDNYLVISTGRSLVSAKKVSAEYGFDKWEKRFLACFNGGIIYDCAKDEIISRNTMDMDDVPGLMKEFMDAGLDTQTYSDTHIVSMADTPGLRFYLSLEDDPYIITDDLESALPIPPCKILGVEFGGFEKASKLRASLEKRFAGKYHCLYTSNEYFEIMPVDTQKGTAVKIICEYLSIPRENSMACGDQENDISMIVQAGTGVAMVNATEDVKAAADIITRFDNNNDGLYDIIKDFTER